MAYRNERINEMIKEELSRLIEFKLKDPRVHESMISITKVNVTSDLKYAKVFVSIMSDNKEEILEILKKAKGFLRKSLAQILNTRYTPDLIFCIDESLDYAAHIDEILKQIKDGEK